MNIYYFELQGVRCAIGYDCYDCLKYNLIITGYHTKMRKLLDYERNGDEREFWKTHYSLHTQLLLVMQHQTNKSMINCVVKITTALYIPNWRTFQT